MPMNKATSSSTTIPVSATFGAQSHADSSLHKPLQNKVRTYESSFRHHPQRILRSTFAHLHVNTALRQGGAIADGNGYINKFGHTLN